MTCKVSTIALLFLFLSSLALSYNIPRAKSEPSTITVPDDFPTIQAAVDNASDGDTIFVKRGTYNEVLVIVETVTLIGEDKNTTIISGDQRGDPVTVLANNVVIEGFTVTGGNNHFNAGIVLQNVNGTIIQNNSILSNYNAGILVTGSNNTILQNRIEDNWYAGIILASGSSNTSVTGNDVMKNFIGLDIHEGATNSLLRNNTISENSVGISLQYHNSFDYFSQDIDASNTVQGKPVYYWIGKNSQIVPSDCGLLVLVSCTNITAQGLSLTNGEPDIYLICTNGSIISECNSVETIIIQSTANEIRSSHIPKIELYSSWSNTLFKNNLTYTLIENSWQNNVTDNNMDFTDYDGLWLLDSANNTISRNTMSNATLALHSSTTFRSSSGNMISENNVTNNNIGFYIQYSPNNTFYHNNFINNGLDIFNPSSSYNVFDLGYPAGGNYWGPREAGPSHTAKDLYRGAYQNETGSDGIEDTPYTYDNYPLMKPHSGPHDIGTLIAASKSVISRGYNSTVTFYVSIINYGEEQETFNFSFHMPGTSYEKELLMESRNSTSFSFNLNTTEFIIGNYSAWTYVSPVSGETDTDDNNRTMTIRIVVPGDVSSANQGVPDGIVNMRDIAYMIILFNTKPSSVNWNPNADVNDDNTVNMRDIAIAIINFNKHE